VKSISRGKISFSLSLSHEASAHPHAYGFSVSLADSPDAKSVSPLHSRSLWPGSNLTSLTLTPFLLHFHPTPPSPDINKSTKHNILSELLPHPDRPTLQPNKSTTPPSTQNGHLKASSSFHSPRNRTPYHRLPMPQIQARRT